MKVGAAGAANLIVCSNPTRVREGCARASGADLGRGKPLAPPVDGGYK